MKDEGGRVKVKKVQRGRREYLNGGDTMDTAKYSPMHTAPQFHTDPDPLFEPWNWASGRRLFPLSGLLYSIKPTRIYYYPGSRTSYRRQAPMQIQQPWNTQIGNFDVLLPDSAAADWRASPD